MSSRPANQRLPPEKVLVDCDNTAKEDDEQRNASTRKSESKKETATETYTKLTQLEHIPKRPDSDIGM
ncbi:hypothetical protein GALMADRAFT_238718 [Galerina marginata CBS 339.88]|uniref:Uncharacterized protein n=1 Tax=Galerina marginata (strain CBS 339.88) TaxID=685588 RepID=A0A067TSX6_GALM3|nr:hypothetical protein GALMADRAFT_238718 [Galerina marginata CBS 339.88]